MLEIPYEFSSLSPTCIETLYATMCGIHFLHIYICTTLFSTNNNNGVWSLCVFLTQLYPFSSLLILLLSLDVVVHKTRTRTLAYPAILFTEYILKNLCLVPFSFDQVSYMRETCCEIFLCMVNGFLLLTMPTPCTLLHHNAIRKKNLLYSHTYLKLEIFNIAQGHSLSFLFATTSRQLCVREFPFRDLLLCLSSCQRNILSFQMLLRYHIEE